MSDKQFAANRYTFALDAEALSFIDDFGLAGELVLLGEESPARRALAAGDADFESTSLMTPQSKARLEQALSSNPDGPVAQLDDAVQGAVAKAKERVRQTPVAQLALSGNIPWLASAASDALQDALKSRYPDHFGASSHFVCLVPEAGVECARDADGDLVLRPYYTLSVKLRRPGGIFSSEKAFDGTGLVKGEVLVNLADQDLRDSVASFAKKRPYMWLLDERSPLYDDQAYGAMAGAISGDEVARGLRQAVARDIGALVSDVEGAIDEHGGRLRNLLPHHAR